MPELNQHVSVISFMSNDTNEGIKPKGLPPTSPGQIGLTVSTEASNEISNSELLAMIKQKSTALAANKLVKMKSNLEVVDEEAEIAREGDES